MDLLKIINAQTSQYVEEKLPDVIKKHLDSMMNNIIEEIFRSYGDNAKAVKKAIEEKIKIDLTGINLVDYNGIIATSIGNHFNRLVEEKSVKPILDVVSSIVGEKYPKESITLDELFEEVAELAKPDESDRDEYSVSFFAEYTEKHDWLHVWCDNDNGKDKDECDTRFIVYGVKRNKECHISSASFDHHRGGQESPLDIAKFGGVQKLIHRLQCSATIIKFPDDLEDGDIYFDRDRCNGDD